MSGWLLLGACATVAGIAIVLRYALREEPDVHVSEATRERLMAADPRGDFYVGQPRSGR